MLAIYVNAKMIIMFLIRHLLMGAGLAMDAFSVSLANGLKEPCMSRKKTLGIASIFGGFQAAMPLIGYLILFYFVKTFTVLQKIIPWVSLALLLFLGIKMICDALKKEKSNECACDNTSLTQKVLVLQGIATSIDALSVGLTLSSYPFIFAALACLIIGVVTFGICVGGVELGKRVGTKYEKKASIAGGIILIVIGVEIFITGII